MRITRALIVCIVFILLTVLTQVGGVIYLACFPMFKLFDKRIGKKLARVPVKFLSFVVVYCFVTFCIIPIIAKPFGRVPLPVITKGNLRPRNVITCLLNRHYVRPALKQIAITAADGMQQMFPGTVVKYLDAGFPFFNGFPLMPHLSHNDGRKLDVAFCYIDKVTGVISNKTPSPVGYGISEEPHVGEVNMAEQCAGNGYWQYSFIQKLVPQRNKEDFVFDNIRTKALVQLFIASPNIKKIFIEPHLKQRLALNSNKIRFHGCHAVRHDDHVHIQLN